MESYLSLSRDSSTTSMSAEYMGMRPLCPCCKGGEHRKGYTCTKYKSRKMSNKARKPKGVRDKRERRMSRPDKFGG